MSRLQRFYIVAAALFLVISACSPPPGPITYDWCYVYNFLGSDYGFNQIYGEWGTYYGFTPDAQGRLSISYVADGVIAPEQVIVNVVLIPELNPDQINVTANALIFGLSTGTVSVSIDPDVDYQQLTLYKQSADDYGSTLNATI